MDRKSREELTAIIEAENGKKWWVPKEFEEHIRSKLPTSLEIISAPPSGAGNFNCFVYALGLENDHEFLGGKNPIQQEFIKYLFNKGILNRKEEASAGDLVFYQNETGEITHGGIVQTDKSILSKWMWGALFAHALWDVPSSFGDIVFYSNPLAPDEAKKEYIEYRDSGVEIKPIS